jgi:DNA modification methylase
MIINADARSIPLADGTVNCCVTSPPYYGLRDYGTARWEGGDPGCDHTPGFKSRSERPNNTGAGIGKSGYKGQEPVYRDICGKCGAVRIDQQIGLEETPDEYVENLVQVCREVWRVMRDDGTLWLNLGDSYSGSGGAGNQFGQLDRGLAKYKQSGKPDEIGLKPKDLIGIPWRVAFALQADGWYLRQDIIWHKPNPMPESVKDRCTKAHEYIFLLTKSARYYYDADAIAEESVHPELVGKKQRVDYRPNGTILGQFTGSDKTVTRGDTRNKRSVWTVNTKPHAFAHFAVYPEELIEPCILAGCPETVCAVCGAPHVRSIEYGENNRQSGNERALAMGHSASGPTAMKRAGDGRNILSTGWQPTCECHGGTTSGTVLDPFSGSGTTGRVAIRNRRQYVGLELNPEYITIQRERLTTEVRLI